MLVLVTLFLSVSAFSQSCLDDVWQCLRSNQVPKAKKFMDACMSENPDNASVWLMQANVNVYQYRYDLERIEKDPNLAPRYPNAVEDAYNAFLKAVSLDKNVTAKTGMFGPKEGQQVLADPFKDMANKAKDKGKMEEALKYYGYAAKCYELSAEKINAAVMYFDMAVVYISMNDKENCTKMLEKSINIMPTLSPLAYKQLYENYEDSKDTVKCGEIIAKAQKAFGENEEQMAVLYSTMMRYYSTVGDNDKLLALCDKAIATGDIDMIADCGTYLTNAKSYAKAEQVLRDALAKDPKNFKLLKGMGYRYAMEYYDIMDRRQKAMNSRQYEEATRIFQSEERKAAMQNAHEWCEKAYEVDSDNLENNLILREMKVQLNLLPIPQELNDKINARKQN